MSVTPHDALAAALLTLCRGGEGIPLDVRVTSSEEVLELRARVAELEESLRITRERLNYSEYKRGCELHINHRLHDLLKEHGIRVPRNTFLEPVTPDGPGGSY